MTGRTNASAGGVSFDTEHALSTQTRSETATHATNSTWIETFTITGLKPHCAYLVFVEVSVYAFLNGLPNAVVQLAKPALGQVSYGAGIFVSDGDSMEIQVENYSTSGLQQTRTWKVRCQ